MTIPDHIATRYESAVKGAARDVYNTYGHFGVFTKRELVDEGWLIAQDRWETWPSAGYARTDLRQKLYHYVERGFPAHGINRVRTSDGRRIYQRTEFPADPFGFMSLVIRSTLGIPDAAYADKPAVHEGPNAVSLLGAMSWGQMDGIQALKFGSILFRDHLLLCADFCRLECRSGQQDIERRRANLRIKWGRELDAARYEAIFGVKPPRALTRRNREAA